jgi:primosomal protein N'
MTKEQIIALARQVEDNRMSAIRRGFVAPTQCPDCSTTPYSSECATCSKGKPQRER